MLISGYSFAMDSWDSTLLETLASNHTVIVFDNRGIGNTTSGSEQKFSISQFANDTAGLLEELNIEKADVLAWSMGGRIAQELSFGIICRDQNRHSFGHRYLTSASRRRGLRQTSARDQRQPSAARRRARLRRRRCGVPDGALGPDASGRHGRALSVRRRSRLHHRHDRVAPSRRR